MRRQPGSRATLALPALFLGAYALTGASPPMTRGPADAVPNARGPTACTLAADTVRIGQSQANVQVRYTEEVGDSLSASVASGSKVTVTAVKKGGTPLTGEVTLNTEQANAGDWELTLAGPKGTCAGTLAVQVGKK